MKQTLALFLVSLSLCTATSFAATSSTAPLTTVDTCYSARIRATAPNDAVVILESTPVARTFEEADVLGLEYCHAEYPSYLCEVAGHLIVDCE